MTGSSFCGLAPYWAAALGAARGAEMVGYQASARGGMVRVAVGRAETEVVLNPNPYILIPKPYTLHLTPYTLHPTPYTLHPTPYTLILKS